MQKNKIKFHGKTYDENLDKRRLTGQIKKLLNAMKSGCVYPCDELSYLSGVPIGSIPKRVSDLRVYHGFNIKAKRINGGLWSYELLDGRSEPRGLAKIKAIGDKKLFGEMQRCAYAYSASCDLVDLMHMEGAASKWVRDFASKLQKGNKAKKSRKNV